jgi:hypothetical protein
MSSGQGLEISSATKLIDGLLDFCDSLEKSVQCGVSAPVDTTHDTSSLGSPIWVLGFDRDAIKTSSVEVGLVALVLVLVRENGVHGEQGVGIVHGLP